MKWQDDKFFNSIRILLTSSKNKGVDLVSDRYYVVACICAWTKSLYLKLSSSFHKEWISSEVLLLTSRYFSWLLSSSITVYLNLMLFFPLNSASTYSIFSGMNWSIFFSLDCSLMNLLSLCLTSEFLKIFFCFGT